MVMREEPDSGSLVVSRVANGGIVELLGEEQTDTFGNRWVLAYDLDNEIEGWILASLVVTATPQTIVPTDTSTPTAAPSSTPTPTATQ
jgi:hypothetical protein